MERYYDEILQAEESEDFTRGDMMVLLKAINDGTARVATATTTPTPAASGPFQAVAAASTSRNGLHACAVRSNGDVACWGYNPLTDSDWNGRPRRPAASRPSPSATSSPAGCAQTAPLPAGGDSTFPALRTAA